MLSYDPSFEILGANQKQKLLSRRSASNQFAEVVSAERYTDYTDEADISIHEIGFPVMSVPRDEGQRKTYVTAH